jgi:hypothetical protein
MLVVWRRQRQPVARDRPPGTGINETTNETTPERAAERASPLPQAITAAAISRALHPDATPSPGNHHVQSLTLVQPSAQVSAVMLTIALGRRGPRCGTERSFCAPWLTRGLPWTKTAASVRSRGLAVSTGTGLRGLRPPGWRCAPQTPSASSFPAAAGPVAAGVSAGT